MSLFCQAGIIGVPGLLLGFTLAMAITRFEARKQVVVEESNAIGTSYLRAQLAGSTQIPWAYVEIPPLPD